MYLWARSWSVQPSEFWNMTIGEWWAEYESNAPSGSNEKFAGKLTGADVEELTAWMEEKQNGDSGHQG